MARTPLANAVEGAVAEIADESARTTRRQLLTGAGAAIAGAGVLGSLARPVRARAGNGISSSRVVVAGAGLAGLTAAYRLQQGGVIAEIYEASGRIGGRCWTGRGDFADGQIYEHGGELIDSNHIQLKQLVQELGLTLDNLVQSETQGTRQLGYFFGRPYTYAQMTDDLKAIWQQIHSDVTAASYPTLYSSYTTRGRQLPHLRQVEREAPRTWRKRPDRDDPGGEARVAAHDRDAAAGDQAR